MFKNLLVCSAISSSFLISPISKADQDNQGIYFTAGLGTGLETEHDGSVSDGFDTKDDTLDFSAKGRTTFDAGIGMGYDLGNMRIETKVSRNTYDINNVKYEDGDKGDNKSDTSTGLSFGLAYDFENDSQFTPFVGAAYSLGWDEDSDDVATGYILELGISTPMSEKIEFFSALSLGITSEQSKDIEDNKYEIDGFSQWGFNTGLRIKI
tara:strand:- start:1445 stop:2071 length:627 start_codon:yes stop_codon:yes gene_type:complete